MEQMEMDKWLTDERLGAVQQDIEAGKTKVNQDSYLETWETKTRTWRHGKPRLVLGDMGKQTDCVPVWDWTMGFGICYGVGICYICA